MIDVFTERERQIVLERHLPEGDDLYQQGELAAAAGSYALFTDAYPIVGQPPAHWPWADEWWKPKDYRRDLVRAAALLLAEIERIDREGEDHGKR